MTREDFIEENPLDVILEQRGIRLEGSGVNRKAMCPFHDDKSPSFSVNVREGVWRCFAGCGGGSVIDFLAKEAGLSPVEFIKREQINNGSFRSNGHRPTKSIFDNGKPQPIAHPSKDESSIVSGAEIEKVYSYHDAFGKEVYQAVRFKPKTFRPRHMVNGSWVWDMEGVERVLYRLPYVLSAQEVWITEGEKDADNLVALGFEATTNQGGAGKWLDGYSESLTGKKVVLCGDNDKAGTDHLRKVFEALAGRVSEIRLIEFPKHFKDVSLYIQEFKSKEEAVSALRLLRDSSHPFIKGYRIPFMTMEEIEPRYSRFVNTLDESSFDLGKWLPTFHEIRPLVPGDLVLILGDTGQGKSFVGNSLVLSALPLPTAIFELELSEEVMFERLVAAKMKIPGIEVERAYQAGDSVGADALRVDFKNLVICTESGLTVEQIESYISRADLKLGQPLKVVVVDYAQLLQGKGSRYERMSDIAEGLKVVAKKTHTIIILVSQVARPSGQEKSELTLHAGKDSGSLENSAGVVIAMWRDVKDKTLLHLRLLKGTRKRSGGEVFVECNFDGSTGIITERSKINDDDIPKTKK